MTLGKVNNNSFPNLTIDVLHHGIGHSDITLFIFRNTPEANHKQKGGTLNSASN
jgi:hypothetical protein